MNSKMISYIIKRFLLAILTVFLIITATFFIMHAIPGNPFASEKATTPATQAALEEKFGLDKPLFVQYVNYLKDIVTKFDFGPSMKLRGRQVIDIVGEGLAVSATLGLIAAASAIVVGVVLGAVAAINRNKVVDRIIMVVTTAFVAMPSFIIGTLLLLTFCLKIQLFSATGNSPDGLVLPIITLALYPMSYITRLTRSSMLDVLGQDYIRTAKAKGVSQVKVIFKHALRNALIPVITYAGPMIAFIVTGSLVVERIFSVPGIGRNFINSILNRDYTLILGTTIVLAVLVVAATFFCDILYKLVDPRIELG